MLNDTEIAFHESAHAVVCKILEEYINVKCLSVDPHFNLPGVIKHPDDRAGCIINRKDTKLANSFALCIQTWAGLFGQNLTKKSKEYLFDNKRNIISNPNSFLDTDGTIGDEEFFNNKFYPFIQNSVNHTISQYLLKEFCFSIIYDFVEPDEVTEMITLLSNHLLIHKSLLNTELEEFYNLNGFNQFLERNRDKLLVNFNLYLQILARG